MENKTLDELVKSLREFEKLARQIRKEIKKRIPTIDSKYLSQELKAIII
jgi:DNA-binding HxlR family transcriptional regulator